MSVHPPSSTLNPRRILIRSVNWLGDAVMTTPALMRLREKFPDAHVSLLTPEKLRELWLHHPAVNDVLSFAPGESPFAIGRRLRAGRFDLALVLPNSPRSALEVFLARIPRRIGYARPWRNWFLTEAIPSRSGAVKMQKRSTAEIQRLISDESTIRPSSVAVLRRADNPQSAIQNPQSHQLHEYLHLTAALGAGESPLAPRIEVEPGEIKSVCERFELPPDVPCFGLNPGAEYGPAKRWPAERFIAAAQEIQKRTPCLWLLFGSKNEMELASRIQAGIGSSKLAARNLAGQTSLRELMALLKFCRVLLTNDTGPMHVAAALGTPVVVPFGSTSPELTGPGLPGDMRHRLLKSDAPCSPCFLRECPIDFRCMNGIAVERVVAGVFESLNR
jgi:heptosyltransferase-2